jgi:hypothetical protein
MHFPVDGDDEDDEDADEWAAVAGRHNAQGKHLLGLAIGTAGGD